MTNLDEHIADIECQHHRKADDKHKKKYGYEIQSYGVSVLFEIGAKPEHFYETMNADA